MKLFLQKNAKFSSAGGFAPRPPLASGGWGAPPPDRNSPPHSEFLAMRVSATKTFLLRFFDDKKGIVSSTNAPSTPVLFKKYNLLGWSVVKP